MHCKIVFTDTAKADICALAVYIADRAKEQNIAVCFVKELQEKARIPEQFPESGAIPEDRVLKSSGCRFLSHKDYLLFYLYEKGENTVYVMAVLNGKRDCMRVIKKFL